MGEGCVGLVVGEGRMGVIVAVFWAEMERMRGESRSGKRSKQGILD